MREKNSFRNGEGYNGLKCRIHTKSLTVEGGTYLSQWQQFLNMFVGALIILY